MLKIKEFLSFIKEKKILSSAFVMISASMINNIIQMFAFDVILPISKGKKTKKTLNEFVIIIMNFIISSYILFIIMSYSEKL